MSKFITNTPRLVSTQVLHRSKMPPAFTLYGARGSSNTDRVRLTLAEGGFTDYELVLLNLQKGEQKVGEPSKFNVNLFSCAYNADTHTPLQRQSEENMKRHPWGKIPVVTFPDEAFTLYESRAICKYLAKKYSFPLVPPESDVQGTALFDQAQSEEMLYFADPAGKLAFEKFAKKFMGLAPDEAVVSGALRSIEAFFDVAERVLQHRDYMAGHDFTLVDIYYIPLIQRVFASGYGDVILSRKAVNAWWDRVINRPAIQKLLAADKEAAATARK